MFLIGLIQLIFQLLYFLVIAGVILSWVRVGTRDASWLYHPVVRFIDDLSNQILRPFRRFLDQILRQMNVRLPIDFSPILAILAFNILEQILITILIRVLPPIG
jgi:uncharacterized protein YggT (Ycf19 family)